MTQPTPEEIRKQRQQRLLQVLADLQDQGHSQAAIAELLCVPAAYLSDVKGGNRTLSELFARRFSDEFSVSYRWLLHGEGTMTKPRIRSAVGSANSKLLPILMAPWIGEVRESPARTGDQTELGGRAAALADGATQPYVLRLPCDAHAADLRKGDLVLISQRDDEPKRSLVVLQRTTSEKKELLLALRADRKVFTDIVTGERVRSDVAVVGQGLALVCREF